MPLAAPAHYSTLSAISTLVTDVLYGVDYRGLGLAPLTLEQAEAAVMQALGIERDAGPLGSANPQLLFTVMGNPR